MANEIDMGNVVGLIQAMMPRMDAGAISSAVTSWLDQHPEATTTVADGSITEQKLATAVAAKLADVTDLKSAVKNCTITSYNLENGGYTSDGGKNTSPRRIRLKNPVFLPKGTKLNFFIGDLYFFVWELSTESTSGGNTITSAGWHNNADYTVQNDSWVMMTFATGNNEPTSINIDVADFIGKSVSIVPANNEINTLRNDVDQYIRNGYTKSITDLNFGQGAFSGTTGIEYSTIRIRLREAVPLAKGTTITFPQNGLYYMVWCLRSDDLTSPDLIRSFEWSQYDTLTIDTDCYVEIACATASTYGDSGNIVPSDFTGIIGIAEPNYTRNGLENANERIDEIERKTDGNEELYLSDFIQAASGITGFNPSTQRLSTLDCVALPFGHRTKLTIKINPNYVVGIRAGRTAQNLASNKYWYRNGDTVTFTAHEQYYRIIIAKPSNSSATAYYTIELSELPDIDLHIYYSFDGGPDRELIDANADNLQYFVNSENVLSASTHGGTDTYPVLLHISDVHGDRKRTETALKIAEYIGADCSIISGDIVANAPIQGLQWMHDLFSNYDGLPIICTGNHDVDNSEYTDADVYNYMMSPSAEKIGNTNGTTYYYTDIASKKIRVIVTDIYQYGATTRSNAHMSTEQLTYICNALASTPAEYGVIIVAHTPCVNVSNLQDSAYPTFFQSLRKYGFSHYDIDGAPIYDIVDAFISRSTINRTYTQSGTPSTITASGDFTGVPTNVEFIAHITGHIHEDSVCYLPTAEKQLMLNICCGNCMNGGQYYPYLADDCDITRLPYGKTQDAINIYVIDRTNKLVKITRIGGTKTYDMKNREYMEIPYADAT